MLAAFFLTVGSFDRPTHSLVQDEKPLRPLLFIHIQKDGGDSVVEALSRAPACAFVRHDLLTRHPKHSNASFARRFYPHVVWESALKFSFVRNPYARAVSWWNMWMVNGRGSVERGFNVQELLDRCGCAESCTFDFFMTECADMTVSDDRRH